MILLRANGVLLVYVGDNFVHTAYLKCRNYVPILRFSCHEAHLCRENVKYFGVQQRLVIETTSITNRSIRSEQYVQSPFIIRRDDVTCSRHGIVFPCCCVHMILFYCSGITRSGQRSTSTMFCRSTRWRP